MTFNGFCNRLMQRTGPAYGAGPAGFKRLMKRLSSPQNLYQIIHVAGTNGKGSVCYLTAQVLQQAGHKTGLFISPHLCSVTERIQINGKPISISDFKRICQRVLDAEEEKLNFFEILTATAFLYFAEKKVTWVVLETGLGGRKDPTNICRPSACVITSIGLDHCQILGKTLQKIAAEKAGIIKPGVPVFCPPFARPVMTVIRETSRAKKAPLFVIKEGSPLSLKNICWRTKQTVLQKDGRCWKLNLLGEKQIQNACLVYRLCRRLNICETAIRKGFENVQIPGRFEIIQKEEKTIILDGAHNPQALANLLTFLQKSPWRKNLAVVCGFMADKDYPAMLNLLSKSGAALYITVPNAKRAATLTQVKNALLSSERATYFGFPLQALEAAWEHCSVVLVTGSFYLVSSVRTALLRARVARRH